MSEDNEPTPLQNITEIVDNVKEKLNDIEYKNIMDNLQMLHNKENRNQIFRIKLLHTQIKLDKHNIPVVHSSVIDREFSSNYLPNNFEETCENIMDKKCGVTKSGKLFFVCNCLYDDYIPENDVCDSDLDEDELEESKKIIFKYTEYKILIFCKIE